MAVFLERHAHLLVASHHSVRSKKENKKIYGLKFIKDTLIDGYTNRHFYL